LSEAAPPLSHPRSPTGSARAERVRQLGIKLAILIAITIAAFLMTRVVEGSARSRARADAAALHARGRALLAAGRAADAVTPLRTAARKDRGNLAYTRAFAEALSAAGDRDGAERTLLTLRADAPDDGQVNLDLARVEAARGDAAAALRFYRSALYAPWPAPDDARRVRLELVHWLLGRHESQRAAAELIAARATTPDTAVAHGELGRLLLQAAEPRGALAEFRRALQLSPRDRAAAAGAGAAAFAIGDYAAARRYLAQAGSRDDRLSGMAVTARHAIDDDPLAPRLGASERRRRTEQAIDYAIDRLMRCDAGAARLPMLSTTREAIHRSGGRELDAIEAAVDAITAAVQEAVDRCPPLTPTDDALLIIGRSHAGTTP
jgi:Flp pilus assembly protein TadD